MSVRLRRTTLAAILLASASTTPAAPPPVRTPITHEKLWMMKRVGTPQVSPDGKWVVFSVIEPSYDQDKEVSDLWLVPADSSAPPRRLTNTKAPEKGVDWSPDSHRLAFATKREGDELEQIYVLDLADGGEARRLTNLATGASNPRWRPDGQAHPVRVLGVPARARRRGEQEDHCRAQGSQVQRARLRALPGAVLESVAG